MRLLVLLLSLSACDKLFSINEIKRPDAPPGKGDASDSDSGLVTDVMRDDDAGLNPSLLAWYPLETTTWEDVTGHGHGGTCSLSSCPTPLQDGHTGADKSFAFSSSRIDIAATGLNTTTAFTVAFWIYATGLDTIDGSCVINKLLGPASSTIQDSWQFCITAAGNARFLTDDNAGGSPNTITSGAVTVNTWHHYALTWNAAGAKQLWIDGMLIGTTTVSIAFDNGPIVVGTDVNSGTNTGTFYGRLDDLRIYDRALSAAEIMSLYGGD